MEKYIGVKIIEAEEMLKDGVEGYKVIYDNPNNTKYESWSPKNVFEEAYRKTDGMTFGLAIEAMKKGFKVARKGWNGKGMFVVYQKGYPNGIPANKQTADAFGIKEGKLFFVQPYMQMKTVDGSCQMWTVSQSDALADDWQIVEVK